MEYNLLRKKMLRKVLSQQARNAALINRCAGPSSMMLMTRGGNQLARPGALNINLMSSPMMMGTLQARSFYYPDANHHHLQQEVSSAAHEYR